MAGKEKQQGRYKAVGAEDTVIKGLALGGHGAFPAAVDVKDGKILRIRPLHLDWKYEKQRFKCLSGAKTQGMLGDKIFC